MDLETVYIRTEKGDAELENDQFALELHDILSRLDGVKSVAELRQEATFWTDETFASALKELLEGEYIRAAAAESGVFPEEEFSPGKSKFARSRRTLIACVLFLDIVEYTKKSVADQFRVKEDFNSLVYDFIREVPEDDRIIIDTGDGAALGFLADPEVVLAIAIRLRDALDANGHMDHPDLHVRMGINLGPVKLVADMNGRENLIGDGVNDANRVMDFAKGGQILASRSFYDVVSRVSNESQRLFKYQGVHKDKHRREHEIYEVTGGGNEPPPEEQAREKTEEEIRAERLEKMKARLEAAAKAEAEARAAEAARERLREAGEEELRKKAEARSLAARGSAPKKWNRKAVLMSAIGMILVAVAVLPFVPLNFLAEDAARTLADRTQEKVTIASAFLSVLPVPRVNLEGVTVGQHIRISKMTEMLLGSGVVLEDVSIDEDGLPGISQWGGFAGKTELKNVRLALNGAALPAFDGEVDFGADGSFRHAAISSGGMDAEIAPRSSGYDIVLTAKNWKLPLGPACPWAEIHAKAFVKDREAKITEIGASGYGGEWSGSASIAWGQDWRGSGRFSGRNLDIEALMPYFSANAKISGTLAFDTAMASSAANFAGLFDFPRFNAAFRIGDGTLGNIDIALAIRAPSPGGTRGGQTKFDQLSGRLSASGKAYRFDQLKMISGLMKTSGEFVLDGGNLGGRMNVSLGRINSLLELGGSLADPYIR